MQDLDKPESDNVRETLDFAIVIDGNVGFSCRYAITNTEFFFDSSSMVFCPKWAVGDVTVHSTRWFVQQRRVLVVALRPVEGG